MGGMKPMSDYILCHHGIKGQKWGVRRFQKKDGSLTPLGRRRAQKEQMQRDAYGLSKKEVKYKIKNAKAVYRNTDGDGTYDGVTGKNWAKVKNDHEKTISGDKTLQRLEQEKRRLEWKRTFSDKESTKRETYEILREEKISQIDARKKEIGEKYTDAYRTALLKDIGYKDTKKGKEMLIAYGIENDWGKAG